MCLSLLLCLDQTQGLGLCAFASYFFRSQVWEIMITHDQTTVRVTQLMEGRIWNRPWQLYSCPSEGSFGVGVLACDSGTRGA